MNLFTWFFGTRSQCTVQQCTQEVMVYYTTAQILIAAKYWDDRGFEAGGEPRVLLPIDATPIVVGTHVLEAIGASKGGLGEKEVVEIAARTFKLAGVSGWEELEEKWEYINVSMKPGEGRLVIMPMRRFRNGGYSRGIDDPIYYCGPVINEVGCAIQKCVRRGRLAEIHVSEDIYDQDIHAKRTNEYAQVGTSEESCIQFLLGDRVSDAFGNCGTILEVDALAEHGLGRVCVRFDDGTERRFAMVSSGLTHLP
jgi:hypothetical protein